MVKKPSKQKILKVNLSIESRDLVKEFSVQDDSPEWTATLPTGEHLLLPAHRRGDSSWIIQLKFACKRQEALASGLGAWASIDTIMKAWKDSPIWNHGFRNFSIFI